MPCNSDTYGHLLIDRRFIGVSSSSQAARFFVLMASALTIRDASMRAPLLDRCRICCASKPAERPDVRLLVSFEHDLVVLHVVEFVVTAN